MDEENDAVKIYHTRVSICHELSLPNCVGTCFSKISSRTCTVNNIETPDDIFYSHTYGIVCFYSYYTYTKNMNFIL